MTARVFDQQKNPSDIKIGLWRRSQTGEVYVSPQWREIYGLSPDDPVPPAAEIRAMFDTWPEGEEERARSEGGGELVAHLWARRRDGARRLVKFANHEEVDKEGLVGERFGAAIDITELGAALADAEAAAHLLNTFVEHAPASIAMFDRDMHYLRVSKMWCEMYGFNVQHVIGRSHYDLFPEMPEHWKAVHRRCQAGAVERNECELFIRADGRRQWVEWEVRPWFDASGDIGGVLMLTRDMTEWKRSVKELEGSERRLRLALEASGDVVWQRDKRTGAFTITCNDSPLLPRQMGTIESERQIWDLVHQEDRAMMISAFVAAVNDGKMLRHEHRMNSPDGEERWALSLIEPIRDEQGVHIGVVGVLRDITEQKREQRKLAEARAVAEAASAAKSQFLATMSHEIRTPLNGVLGVAQSLMQTPLNAEQREMVSLLLSAGGALRELVNGSLDVGRIESGALKLESAPFNVATSVHEAAMLYAASARAKGLTFDSVALTGAELRVVGDEARVRQIISNLVSNAVKFTAQGAVRVECSITGADNDCASIKVSVRDTGEGFDESAKARLFQRFQQIDEQHAKAGAGLGLAIARSLARAMGGDIDCLSAPGVGSIFTFSVELPAAPVEPAAPRAQPQAGLIEILIAEDHPMNQKILTMLLAGFGARLTFVESGLDACAMLDKSHFDVVLMDVQMPLMDGLTATRLIRAREAMAGRKRVPIICLTAQDSPEKLREADRAGVDAHVGKPIDKAQLIDVINSLLGEQKLRAVA